uniref:Uncharacterized protein n=1 Tax=Sphaerodactylus townsendi TaxID=933632 RepID=A0ACB8FQ86_9SAUR
MMRRESLPLIPDVATTRTLRVSFSFLATSATGPQLVTSAAKSERESLPPFPASPRDSGFRHFNSLWLRGSRLGQVKTLSTSASPNHQPVDSKGNPAKGAKPREAIKAGDIVYYNAKDELYDYELVHKLIWISDFGMTGDWVQVPFCQVCVNI